MRQSMKSSRFLESRTREWMAVNVLENLTARVREPYSHDAALAVEYEIVLKRWGLEEGSGTSLRLEWKQEAGDVQSKRLRNKP